MTSPRKLKRSHDARSVGEVLRNLWCGWTHGGGDIKRDHADRINWQCRKCGRWSTPVEREEEAAAICAETGQHKDPRGCWNVRCQLGNRCSRAGSAPGGD